MIPSATWGPVYRSSEKSEGVKSKSVTDSLPAAAACAGCIALLARFQHPAARGAVLCGAVRTSFCSVGRSLMSSMRRRRSIAESSDDDEDATSPHGTTSPDRAPSSAPVSAASHDNNKSQSSVAVAESRLRKVIVRSVVGFFMVTSFVGIVWAGHLYLSALVVLIQVGPDSSYSSTSIPLLALLQVQDAVAAAAAAAVVLRSIYHTSTAVENNVLGMILDLMIVEYSNTTTRIRPERVLCALSPSPLRTAVFV